MEYLTVKEMPESERPYEKFEKKGAECLSDAELLAVIIRTGTRNERSIELAQRVLLHSKVHKGLDILNHISLKELQAVKGIGRVKAIQLLCVAELAKRIAMQEAADGKLFNSDDIIAGYYMQSMRCLSREQVVLVMLDTRGRLIADKIISIGTINASLVSAREIFCEALRNNAANVVILHNHPSGDPGPSNDDIRLTKRVIEAGNIIGIPLLDHIIIGDNRYLSLKREGYI